MVIGRRSQRAIRGLDVESSHVCPWRLKGLLLAATANGQSNVPFRLLLLTKAAPDYRHCGLVAPAHFSKGLETREKRLKLDEASVAVGRAMCRLMPLHGSLHPDRPSCQKRTKTCGSSQHLPIRTPTSLLAARCSGGNVCPSSSSCSLSYSHPPPPHSSPPPHLSRGGLFL
jgi:hypothetical protein